MAIIKTISTASEFINAWPESRRDQFSATAKEALFDYLDSTDEDVEFDPIALCCEYTEYASADEFAEDFPDVAENGWAELDEDSKCNLISDYLEDQTSVILCEDGCILFANF